LTIHWPFMKMEKVYGWGSNRYGQLGLGTNVQLIETPQEIPSLSQIKVARFKTTIYPFIEWTTKNHKLFSKRTKEEIFTILLLSLLNPSTSTPYHPNSKFYLLPKDMRFELFKFVATPQDEIVK